jgi:thiol-disulfide isomerase/thioredoxin
MSDNISPLSLPTRSHHAEVNGSQVITKRAMPEPVLVALASLVDALGTAFGARDDEEREADLALTRRRCPRHVGQYADFCGPCRSEQIGDDQPVSSQPAPSIRAEAAAAAIKRTLAEVKRRREEQEAAEARQARGES